MGWRRWWSRLVEDESFLQLVHDLERWISKVLSLGMIGVICILLLDLGFVLISELTKSPTGIFGQGLIVIFGSFLNILIALELLENITAYLRKQVVQVELVIVTALIAVARKLIIFDFSKGTSLDLVGLGAAITALSVAYWIVRGSQPPPPGKD
ncbi:MAG: phosphate-starvation-inducible PsiE family protein [Thermostichales cyanobacterium SZTDM-1c_bins_54]